MNFLVMLFPQLAITSGANAVGWHLKPSPQSSPNYQPSHINRKLFPSAILGDGGGVKYFPQVAITHLLTLWT